MRKGPDGIAVEIVLAYETARVSLFSCLKHLPTRARPKTAHSHFLLVAFLISVAALFASASFAKPMIAEYLLPMA